MPKAAKRPRDEEAASERSKAATFIDQLQNTYGVKGSPATAVAQQGVLVAAWKSLVEECAVQNAFWLDVVIAEIEKTKTQSQWNETPETLRRT